jgi:hypothetical protein
VFGAGANDAHSGEEVHGDTGDAVDRRADPELAFVVLTPRHDLTVGLQRDRERGPG